MDNYKELKAEAEDVLYNIYTAEDSLDMLFEAIGAVCRNDDTQYYIYKYIVDNFGYIKD